MKPINKLIPMILAGGTGSRLWPLSRQLHPKQFLALTDAEGHSMLQATLQRVHGWTDFARTDDLTLGPPLLICNEAHRFLAAEQLRAMGEASATLLLEPVGRNTAPAIALAALHALSDHTDPGCDPLLLVLAADHLVQDPQAFYRAVDQALPLAKAGQLVTFGIVPLAADTGYGYIERGNALPQGGYAVKRFVEKPDLATAQAYLDGGTHFWNSGMFLFRASSVLAELRRWAPAVVAACEAALDQGTRDMDFFRVEPSAFAACPNDSIDYAVMEKTDSAVMVPLDAGWSDIGSWSALWAVSPQDANGNVLRGDTVAQDTYGTYVHADSRLVTTLGVHNLVVVETKDAVLVAHRDAVQDVKKVVDRLKSQGRTEPSQHREVYRPWGMYDSIDCGSRYQVKRITVLPGRKLSLQMHHHRAEHWIVVKGTARVTNGDKVYFLTENESTFIPIGQVHSLENPGVLPLELIEVQSGGYLGEDDIVRLEDRYGRIPA